MVLGLHKTRIIDFGRWDDGYDTWPVIVSVPRGLEGACAGIARRENKLRLKVFCHGLLRAQRAERDSLIQTIRGAPIWSFGSFILVCTIDVSELKTDRAILKATNALNSVADQFKLNGESYWLNCPKSESREVRKLGAQLLDAKSIAISNNPSDYRLTLQIVSENDKIHVLLGPSISIKERFSYRSKDVGGSINPVLAAAMVRLAPPALGGTVLDPTCGSGTLLAERLAFSDEAGAIGIDVSATAGEAFRANLSKSACMGKFQFRLGDGADPANWESCRTVLANLPFGIRVRMPRAELERLYAGVLRNASEFLESEGRIIVTSSFKSALDQAVVQYGERLQILSRYKAEMGGLIYQILVAAKS